jgi:hypothetical protein
MTALERLTLLLRHEACWESCSLLPRLALPQQEFYQRTLDSLGRDVGMKPLPCHVVDAGWCLWEGQEQRCTLA